MTLHVPFDEFPDTVKRLLDHSEAYLEMRSRGVVVTAVHPTKARLVASSTHLAATDARKVLENKGMTIHPGRWTLEVEPDMEPLELKDAYIGAVAYESNEERPGIWVDVFAEMPTQVLVLRALYEEFRSTGELADVSFEEFVRLGKPNVAIVSPAEITKFLAAKEPGC